MRHYLFNIGLILMLIILTQGCIAFETNMLMVKEINISMNLSPDHNVSYASVPSNQEGSFGQLILINNTNETKLGTALLIISFYDRSMLEANTSEMSNFMENMLFGAFKLGGVKEKESYNLADAHQKNVTIHAMLMPQKGKPSELGYMGYWSFDKLNHFFLMSGDKNLTRQIVESLEVKDPSKEN
jgi:hypothetical protein